MASARKFEQAGRAVLLEATKPFADGRPGGSKEPCAGFDAALFSTLDQTKPMVVSVLHLPHQIEITGGRSHGATILAAARRPALSPAGRPSPTASSRSNTSTPPGGYDVTRLFHRVEKLVSESVLAYIYCFGSADGTLEEGGCDGGTGTQVGYFSAIGMGENHLRFASTAQSESNGVRR
jgi:hypothetical protein